MLFLQLIHFDIEMYEIILDKSGKRYELVFSVSH